MRTSLDLPSELHEELSRLASATGKTLSRMVADLLRRALGAADVSEAPTFTIDEQTGLPVFPSTGRTISNEDVWSMVP